MQDIFVGRQPIYNNNLGIYAYEMLFRAGKENTAGQNLNHDHATSQVVINTFVDMGLDNLVGSALASIKLTERFLTNVDALPIPPERVILDIHSDINLNQETIDALNKLKDIGFTLSLRDIEGTEDIPNFNALLKLTDIIKIDIRQNSTQAIKGRLNRLKKFNLKLMAEKIETLDEYEAYNDMGFDYFHGYFLCVPRIIKGKTLENNKLSTMRLLSTLHSADTDIREVEEAISSDLTLSYKLLKLVNSALFNLPSEVDSIKRAVVFLGRRQLTSWVTMLALSSIGKQPIALIKIGMVRARICELIAERFGLKNEDQFFTAGMFSALDIIMERSIETLIVPLPLSDEVKRGILEHQGNIGTLVKISQLLETSAAERIKMRGISKAELSALYLQADQWADNITRSIK
jgi:EAL and modified HD-GYP domain-containing signal transduction protein